MRTRRKEGPRETANEGTSRGPATKYLSKSFKAQACSKIRVLVKPVSQLCCVNLLVFRTSVKLCLSQHTKLFIYYISNLSFAFNLCALLHCRHLYHLLHLKHHLQLFLQALALSGRRDQPLHPLQS